MSTDPGDDAQQAYKKRGAKEKTKEQQRYGEKATITAKKEPRTPPPTTTPALQAQQGKIKITYMDPHRTKVIYFYALPQITSFAGIYVSTSCIARKYNQVICVH